MKKLIAIALVLALALSLSVTAFAGCIDQDSTSKSTNVEVTTSIAPSYIVTIPANTTVTFNTLTTSFGSVKLESAQIHPGGFIEVTLDASSTLKNKYDVNLSTIAYTIKSGNSVFKSANFYRAGQEKALTINITQDAWNAAYAGEYSDTVTFTVAYWKPVITATTPEA